MFAKRFSAASEALFQKTERAHEYLQVSADEIVLEVEEVGAAPPCPVRRAGGQGTTSTGATTSSRHSSSQQSGGGVSSSNFLDRLTSSPGTSTTEENSKSAFSPKVTPKQDVFIRHSGAKNVAAAVGARKKSPQPAGVMSPPATSSSHSPAVLASTSSGTKQLLPSSAGVTTSNSPVSDHQNLLNDVRTSTTTSSAPGAAKKLVTGAVSSGRGRDVGGARGGCPMLTTDAGGVGAKRTEVEDVGGIGGGGCPMAQVGAYEGEYYPDYLQLEKILNAQFPVSGMSGPSARGARGVFGGKSTPGPSFLADSIAREATATAGGVSSPSKARERERAGEQRSLSNQKLGVVGENEAHDELRYQPPGEAHDETLFIITHQAYELWFKQILHELESIYKFFVSEYVEESEISVACHRLHRITKIQEVLIQQIGILETMTPMGFLDFRDYLVPASGFQSLQFRIIEISLGIPIENRRYGSEKFILGVFSEEDRRRLQNMRDRPSLSIMVEQWLERMPFFQTEEYDFWRAYEDAVETMISRDEELIQELLPPEKQAAELKSLKSLRTTFQSLFSEEIHAELLERGVRKWSHKALLAALFIFLYRDEPMLTGPFRLLNLLMEIDENFGTWRLRHASMAHRMIGMKIGTGGTSGVEYLNKAAGENKAFRDLWSLSTFLIPSSALPQLPPNLKHQVGFHHTFLMKEQQSRKTSGAC